MAIMPTRRYPLSRYNTPKRRRTFVPGRDRTSGYYGRFAGSRGLGELKFWDLEINQTVTAAGGAITPSLNLIPQGVTESQRVGRKCTIKAIHWKWQLVLPETDAVTDPASPCTVRMIVYQDKQCNGAAATSANILEDANYQSFRNLSNTSRFNIFMDKTVQLNYMGGMASDGAGVVSQVRTAKNGTFNKKCSIPIEFDSTTGAITEIRSNNLGVLIVANDAIAIMDSKVRLRFSDN